MYKYKPVAALMISAVLLTACNPEESADLSTVTTESKLAEDLQQQDWASLPEYDTIIDTVGDRPFEIEMVEDQQGKRVLLIVDSDGAAQYKTIFVKKTNRLKIIHIDGEGLLFNDILDDL